MFHLGRYQPLSREQFEAVQQSLEQVLMSQGKGLSMNGRNIDHSDFYKVKVNRHMALCSFVYPMVVSPPQLALACLHTHAWH